MLAKQYAEVSEYFSRAPREQKKEMRTCRMIVKQALDTKCTNTETAVGDTVWPNSKLPSPR